MTLTAPQMHRAAGVLLGTAAGDALGAGYEFGPALPDDAAVEMQGGGTFGWGPGEWTDDTAMALAIAESTAAGQDLRDPDVLAAIGERWCHWAKDATDVGVQTRAVLTAAQRTAGGAAPTAEDFTRAAEAQHQRTGRSGGNGSLMRTAPVALAHLSDPAGLTHAALQVSALTHYDQQAGQACVLWCHAIRQAILTGSLDIRAGLTYLDPADATAWQQLIEDAEAGQPADFGHNGWVVHAFQQAWCTISTTPIPDQEPARHLQLTLERVVRAGGDTDTVAAIAGGLLGAAYGASAVPSAWSSILHGWPESRSDALVGQAVLSARGGRPDATGWPTATHIGYSSYGDIHQLARHPLCDRLLLSGVGNLDPLPPGVDAVVSLCRVGSAQVQEGRVSPQNHLSVWLVDSDDPAANPNLNLVLTDTVSHIHRQLEEGRTVLLHCVQAQSRTPTLAALYAMRIGGLSADDALHQLTTVLPAAHPNPAFRQALQRFDAR